MTDHFSRTVDLYLGGDLGVWVLQQIPTDSICQVLTLDSNIAQLAQNRGLQVHLTNANGVDFSPGTIGFSVHYPRILREVLISKYQKMYNLHPGYLPWGRGYYPVFWALWEGTPAGATLHEITAGIDEGAIVAQSQVVYDHSDTGGSLWYRVREAEKMLFQTYWEKISSGHYPTAVSQIQGGTYHSKKEFFHLKKETDWRKMSGHDLIKLIRCLSFPGYSGLEILLENKRFAVHLESLTKEEFVNEKTDE